MRIFQFIFRRKPFFFGEWAGDEDFSNSFFEENPSFSENGQGMRTFPIHFSKKTLLFWRMGGE
jgi:hypothetical protein